MKQLSPFFVVVGETPTFSVCETINRGGQYVWRFVIEWDEDHDLRVVDLVNHLISRNELAELDVTTIGESSGRVIIWSELGAEHFCRHYVVDGDQWFVVVEEGADVVGRRLGAGARPFVDVVKGVL
jgi:hypothetical protein